jgi:hypothetical protein
MRRIFSMRKHLSAEIRAEADSPSDKAKLGLDARIRASPQPHTISAIG